MGKKDRGPTKTRIYLAYLLRLLVLITIIALLAGCVYFKMVPDINRFLKRLTARREFSFMDVVLFGANKFVFFQILKVNEYKTLSILRSLIVDQNCLRNLDSGTKCSLPIKLAIGSPPKVLSNHSIYDLRNEHFTVEWTIEEDPDKHFWLFKDVNLAAQTRATTRY
jgi:hypothetical protein